MSTNNSQEAILKKFGISELNEMQQAAHAAIAAHDEVVLLSPTGTGKTLAFLLPMLTLLNPESKLVQTLILVPSRELAIQIEQVARDMGSGYKINAVYGGRSGSKDRMELKHAPAILIGTPGRVADHIRREAIDVTEVKTLILDEFDKSLETGFEKEMKEIVEALPALQNKILTSATQKVEVPAFVGLRAPERLNFLGEGTVQLTLKSVISPDKDKLETLEKLLWQVGSGSGIIFCNFKDTITFVSDFLEKCEIDHACFYGGLEQADRERSLIMFRNGTHKLLLATDLAARGIDVPELDYIIHYQLPPRLEEFTHRNGRTARMNSEGTAYVMQWAEQELPEFVQTDGVAELTATGPAAPTQWETLFISGGRRDKISKGDIAGLFFKQGGLKKDQLGTIELKQDCAFVAVPYKLAPALIRQLNNTRLKKKKVRISLVE